MIVVSVARTPRRSRRRSAHACTRSDCNEPAQSAAAASCGRASGALAEAERLLPPPRPRTPGRGSTRRRSRGRRRPTARCRKPRSCMIAAASSRVVLGRDRDGVGRDPLLDPALSDGGSPRRPRSEVALRDDAGGGAVLPTSITMRRPDADEAAASRAPPRRAWRRAPT